MTTVGQPFSSGNWVVKDGQEDEFIARWTDFVRWSIETMGEGAFDAPILIREDANPRHFISFGGWRDAETVAKWRSHPEFQERLGRARELCDEFVAGDYTAVAAPQL
jgi:heme-degrading monooxygenase HmoA